jgi:hypothetical protein
MQLGMVDKYEKVQAGSKKIIFMLGSESLRPEVVHLSTICRGKVLCWDMPRAGSRISTRILRRDATVRQ